MMMENKRRILLPFSGTRNSINQVIHIIEISNLQGGIAVDLLHIRSFNSHGARYFPTDVLDRIAFHCDSFLNCYSCDGNELARFLKENADHNFPLANCQFCQTGINLTLAYFIKKMGYDETLYCGPLFDPLLCEIPALMILKDPEFPLWSDPILDYRFVSRKVKQRCVRNSCEGWNNTNTMSADDIRELCRKILDAGILDRMVMQHIEFESEWNVELF